MIVCTSLIATKQNKDDGSRTGMAVSRIRDEQNERTDEKESIRNERMKKTSKELRLISVKKIDFCEYLNWRAICTHDFGLQICKPKSCTYWLSQEMKAVSGQVFMATPPKKLCSTCMTIFRTGLTFGPIWLFISFYWRASWQCLRRKFQVDYGLT